MSMKGKQTKGKQKIEMKKVEADADRMITFSKRKSGIYKKMNEIITSCGVEAAFLVFSQVGKPYSLANPSMEELADRLKNPARSELSTKVGNNNTGPLIEAYKKNKIEALNNKYMGLFEDLDMENKKVKQLKESKNKMWWNSTLKNLTVEQIEQRHQAFVELYDNLRGMALSRSEEDDDRSSYV